MEPEPQSDYEARAAALSADQFLTLLPGAAAQNAGIVFRGKKKKNAAGVWGEAAESTDAGPEVLYIKPGTWADEDEDVELDEDWDWFVLLNALRGEEFPSKVEELLEEGFRVRVGAFSEPWEYDEEK